MRGKAHVPFGKRKLIVILAFDFHFKDSTIVIKKETFTFLENLCGSSLYKYNVLCGFCRIFLAAKTEGHFFQTCVWVSAQIQLKL